MHECVKEHIKGPSNGPFFLIAAGENATMSLAELGTEPGKVETIEQRGTYLHDPLAEFTHLCANKANALLLESAEIDSKDDLQSLLMVDAAMRLVCKGNQVICTALTKNGESVLPLLVFGNIL